MERPPPEITMIDPRRPNAPLLPHLQPDPPPPLAATARARPATTIAIALVLLQLVAVPTAVVQQRHHDQEGVRADRALTQVTVDGPTPLAGVNGTSVAVGYALRRTSATLSGSLEVDGDGWDGSFTSGIDGTIGVLLEHPTECDRPLRQAPSATVVLTQGGHRRRVLLPAPTTATVEQVRRRLCGQLLASDALDITPGEAYVDGQGIAVDLGLVNASVHAVRVTGITSDGLEVTTGPLPLLRPRATGPVHVVVRVRRCLGIDSVLTSGAGTPLSLKVAVSGAGGPGLRTVDVPGLLGLVRSLVREHCTD